MSKVTVKVLKQWLDKFENDDDEIQIVENTISSEIPPRLFEVDGLDVYGENDNPTIYIS